MEIKVPSYLLNQMSVFLGNFKWPNWIYMLGGQAFEQRQGYM